MSKQANSFLQSLSTQEVESSVEEQLEEIGSNEVEEQVVGNNESSEVEEEVKPNNEEAVVEDQESAEYFSFYEDNGEGEVSNTENDPVVEPVKVKDKVKVSLKDYVEQYQDNLNNYFKYKNLDVDNMSSEELVKFKLKQEHPSWSDEDIKDELRDTYGLGLKEKQIPEDALDEEIEKINDHNERIKERIRRGERLMKADVEKSKKLLKEEQSKLELPEVELDVELDASPEKVIEQYNQQLIEQNTKFLEEIWKPNITEAVSKVGGFKQPLEIDVQNGDKVVSELNYKLTTEQKSTLTDYLSSYQSHPSDEQYVVNKETGEIDFQRFVSDKAMSLFAKDIIKASVKEAVAKVKEKLVKEEMINFQEEPRRVAKTGSNKDFAVQTFERFAQRYQKR